MTYKFNKEIEFLNPQLFNDKIVYIPENAFKNPDYKEIADFLIFCKTFGITFKKDSNYLEVLSNFSPGALQEIRYNLTPKLGVTFFNLKKEYGLEEFWRTIFEYLKSYNNITEIPDELFINFPNTKAPKVNKEYEFVEPSCYFEKLWNILNSSKNPTSKDNMFLYETSKLDFLKVNYILNRNVLKELSKNCKNFKFLAKDTAQLREFYNSLGKVRTSNKTFIMKSLNTFQEGEVLSDFNSNKGFWKYVEHNLKPTQKKYSKYPNTQRFFKLLRNNEFKTSYNSIVEDSLQKNSLLDFFKLASKLKSPQYAARNVTKYLKNNDYKEQEVKELLSYIENNDIKIKVLIELYKGLLYQTEIKTYKIKNKFWITQDNKTYNFDYFANELKNIILKKVKVKALEFVKLENNEENTKIPAISRSVEELKRVPFPTGTDNFFKVDTSKGYVTRGTKLKLSDYVKGDYIVFVAWRMKNYKRGEYDLDLSGIEFLNDDIKNLKCEYASYFELESKNMKHSGDFTFCKEFNPETGLITCECILVKENADNLHFLLNTYNEVSLKDLDIFVGICDAKDYGGQLETGLLNIEKAKLLFEISQDFTGFYKLFSITNGYLMLEGVNCSEKVLAGANSENLNILASSKYIERLHCLNVYDFVKDLGIEVYNPYKLEILMDYVINS